MSRQKISVLPSKILLMNSASDSYDEFLLDALSEDKKADIQRTMSINIGQNINLYYTQHHEEWCALLKNLS